MLPEIRAAAKERLALRRPVSERGRRPPDLPGEEPRQGRAGANLTPECEGRPFGKGGRRWLGRTHPPMLAQVAFFLRFSGHMIRYGVPVRH